MRWQGDHRGGLGHEVVKRAGVVQVIPPPVEAPDWDTVVGEEKAESSRRDLIKTGNGVKVVA